MIFIEKQFFLKYSAYIQRNLCIKYTFNRYSSITLKYFENVWKEHVHRVHDHVLGILCERHPFISNKTKTITMTKLLRNFNDFQSNLVHLNEINFRKNIFSLYYIFKVVFTS